MSAGPSSLDSDASFILTSDERPAQITATKLPRATTNNHSVDQPAVRTRDKHFWHTATADKYDYRNVNLTGSVSEKMGKRIMSADEYGWRHTTSVDRDGKEWQRTRRSSHHQNGKDLDWEYNVQQYENLGERSGARLQYYEATDSPVDFKKNSSATLDDKKEIKFPGLKTFKSASMRLPGQKSSMQEVQQLLRLKFNRINIGLRKRRALSVQEVFPPERSTSQSSALNGMPVRPPSQFYVPSPLAYKNNNNNYKDDEGPASLPFFINDAMKQSSQQHYTKDNLNNKHTVTISRASPDLNGRTQNNSDRINTSNDLGRDRVLETPSSSVMSSSSVQPTQKNTIIAPQFVVGGCVSNGSKHASAQHTSRLSDVSTATTTSLEKIRLRPRSHSPLKTADDKAKNRKKRESFGFFERINRMMHAGIQQLPPPHSSTTGNRANNTKMNSASANNNNINNTISTQANNNRNGNIDSGGTGAEYTYRRTSSNKNVKNLTLTSITALRSTTADAETNRTTTKPDTLLLRDRKPSIQQVCRSLSNLTATDCFIVISIFCAHHNLIECDMHSELLFVPICN